MDWTKQNEAMFKAWTDTQKKMWDTFSESMAGFGKSPSEKLWEQTIKAGEELVKNSFAAQAEWMNAWSENFKNLEGMPSQATEALIQFQEMTERWAATQEKLWAAWFDMLKKMDPSQFTGTWGEMPKNPFQVWQDSTKMVMDTQMEWMQAWMDQFKPAEEE
jgi:polyhydroxyalkanoate synthesis regulator protein